MKLPAWLRHPFIGRFEPIKRRRFTDEADEAELLAKQLEARHELKLRGVQMKPLRLTEPPPKPKAEVIAIKGGRRRVEWKG